MTKKRTRPNLKKKYAKHFLKIFFGVFFGIILLGIIAVGSIYLVRKMSLPTISKKEEEPPPLPVEEFPNQVQFEEQEIQELPNQKYAELLNDPQRMLEENVYTKEGREKDQVTLVFGGDILLDSNYAIMSTYHRNGWTIEKGITEPLLSQMREADICMLNNEFPYSLRGAPTPEKTFTFRANPEAANILTQMGVDAVSLANNHAYDYGEDALIDTFEALRKEGIPYVGAGANLEEASKPLYFIINDIKIAIVSATQIERLDHPDTKEATETSPGVFRCWNPALLCERIQEAEQNSDFVIVFVHWGTENEEQIDWAQREQAPKYVKAGADLIIGAHPHCLQKTEYIEGVPVIYSLGNFWFNSKSLDTALARVTITKEGLQTYELLPCKQENCMTRLLDGEEKQRVITYMNSISPDVTIDSEGTVQNTRQ